MPTDTQLDEIAVIDLAPLANGSMRGKQQVGDALRETLERVGFFIVINHGVPYVLIEQTFAEAKRFHAQSQTDKHAVLMNAHNNGFMAAGRYNVSTSRVSEASAKPDLNEAFFIKRERRPDDPLVLAERRFAGPNEWPSKLPGFRQKVLQYTDCVDALARRLLPPLALSLDLAANTFDAAFAESQFSFRLSHYPAVREREADQYGIAPHTDANFLTFLAHSEVPGLQIRTSADHWLDVPYIPGSFVVNSGDMLHRWTNARYQSTPHRALAPIEQDRYAIPYFFGPHLDTVIECLPSCQSIDDPAKFAPITYADYVAWWYDANYNTDVQQDLSVAAAE
jgi:isopenicillin N synthase-like dioxygenase